jgi:hypothetical protein
LPWLFGEYIQRVRQKRRVTKWFIIATCVAVIGAGSVAAYEVHKHNSDSSDDAGGSSLAAATVKIAPDEALSLINNERSKAQVPALSENAQLVSAAIARANDMFAKGYYDNSTISPWSYVQQSGYKYQYLEAVSYKVVPNTSSSSDAFSAIMNGGYKPALLSKSFTNIGIAVVDGQLKGYPTTLLIIYVASPQPTASNPSYPSVPMPYVPFPVATPYVVKPFSHASFSPLPSPTRQPASQAPGISYEQAQQNCLALGTGNSSAFEQCLHAYGY